MMKRTVPYSFATIVQEFMDLLEADPTDRAAASRLLQMIDEEHMHPDVVYYLYGKAISAVYFNDEGNDKCCSDELQKSKA